MYVDQISRATLVAILRCHHEMERRGMTPKCPILVRKPVRRRAGA